jgi:hypothetical protein
MAISKYVIGKWVNAITFASDDRDSSSAFGHSRVNRSLLVRALADR